MAPHTPAVDNPFGVILAALRLRVLKAGRAEGWGVKQCKEIAQ